MKYFFYALLGMIVISSCTVIKNNKETTMPNNTSNIAGLKWQLIEINGQAVPDKINGKVPFLNLQVGDTTYNANAGCNGMGGVYKLADQGKIQFSRGLSTMMACESMEIESQFAQVLIKTDNYSLADGILSLNKGKMAPLAKFKVAQDAIPANPLNGTWEVNYISGPRIAFEGLYPENKPTITFDVANNKASGTTSCNRFNTGISLNGNNLYFAAPATTRMACPGNGEATFLSTLKTITSYSVSENTLTLIMGDIAVMRLHRK